MTSIGAAGPDASIDLAAQFDTCARMPEHPIEIPYDPKLVKACKTVLAAGYRAADAHYFLGRHFVLSHQEIEKAVYHLRRGAAMGNAKATTGLGYLHETHQYRWEPYTALDYFLRLSPFTENREAILSRRAEGGSSVRHCPTRLDAGMHCGVKSAMLGRFSMAALPPAPCASPN